MTQAESARHFYDRVSHVYDALADTSEREARSLGMCLLAPSGSERVLEIGCGTGHSLVEAAQLLGENGRVYGVDISPGMLAVASQRVRASPAYNRIGGLALADAKGLPWRDQVFDAVFLSFTLELFSSEDIPPVLDEIARMLVPGGRLGVVSLNDDGSRSMMTDLYRFLHCHFPHIIDCQPIAVRALLERAGFELITSEGLSIWGLPVAVVAARRPDSG